MLDWRMSISQGHIGASPGFFPLAINAAERQKLGIPNDSMAIEPFMGTNTSSAAYKAGIRPKHVVTAVNGHKPNLAGRAFLVWFRQQFDEGDQVAITVHDENQNVRTIKYNLSEHDH